MSVPPSAATTASTATIIAPSSVAPSLAEPKTWDALVQVLDSFGEGFANEDWVFRGEPSLFSQTLPLIDRLIPRDPERLAARMNAELNAVQLFRANAPMHLHDVELKLLDEGMQAQTIMRHYGAPTRLLDWTQSPWVALFFACRDAAGPTAESSGRILAFNRSAVERRVANQFGPESKAHCEMVVNAAGWLVPKMLTVNFAESAGDWVVCYHRHASRFPRLVAQQGLFTIGSKPWLDHWSTVEMLSGGDCREVTILPALKLSAMRRLARMGLTSASLFPGIEGVARDATDSVTLWHSGRV